MDNETTQPTASKSMMPMIIIAVLIVVGLGIFLLSSKSNKQTTTDNAMSPTQAIMMEDKTATQGGSTTPEVTEEANVKTIEIEAGSYYYKPNTITVKKGDKVKVVIKSVDMMHNFNIDELGVKSDTAKAGETATVEFTADKVGSFEYYCAIGQHRKMGQVGTITVE